MLKIYPIFSFFPVLLEFAADTQFTIIQECMLLNWNDSLSEYSLKGPQKVKIAFKGKILAIRQYEIKRIVWRKNSLQMGGNTT